MAKRTEEFSTGVVHAHGHDYDDQSELTSYERWGDQPMHDEDPGDAADRWYDGPARAKPRRKKDQDSGMKYRGGTSDMPYLD